MDLTPDQERAIGHGEGALLVLGEAGTGKTETLALRLARLADDGTGVEEALAFTSTRATAQRLSDRVEALLGRPHELWIGTWDAVCERLLHEHSDAAGLDPFFDVLGPAERLAMLLDRLDELPLRQHEIRGNPAGLLAQLLERIDALKAGSDPPEPEFAALYAAHDSILAGAGSIDRGDVFLTLNKLLGEHPDIRRDLAARFPHVVVDELEEATTAQRAILATLAEDNPSHVYALEDEADPAAAWFRKLHPEADVVMLDRRFRRAPVRFWRCSNERAQAQAVAREAEHLLGEGIPPGEICVLIDDPAARGGPVSAAMEERGIPFHVSGSAALFRRPEVRDAIAWLRVLADPADSAAAARSLTRPPIELRSDDLARLATIARRRSLDLVSACEAALESPQIRPEARERIQSFLKLYAAASAAMEERRADVFVRRLIERVGLRRQRLFAAQPEVAERLLGLSRLAELATAWARREPHGSTRDFVRHLSAVAEAGVEPIGMAEPPAPGAVQGMERTAAKGMEFDHVFLIGLEDDSEAERTGQPARSGLVFSWVERDGEGRGADWSLWGL
ncbi:MAG: ATP-dependent helicase, partial [Solirubrobacterales bacterium]